jgi:hypothetical protein
MDMKIEEINTIRDSKRYEFQNRSGESNYATAANQPYYCFLFNDILLYTVPGGYSGYFLTFFCCLSCNAGCYQVKGFLRFNSIASVEKLDNLPSFVMKVAVNNILRVQHVFTCDKEEEAKIWSEGSMFYSFSLLIFLYRNE